MRPALGVGIVAAVYVYFLIFAQFAFLRLATAQGFTPNQLRELMAVMGLAGIASSLVTAHRLAPANLRWMLVAGFAVAAAAAGMAVTATHLALFLPVSALIGLSVGTLTVTLAASLPRLLDAGSIGRCAGAGTGLAYAACNLPAVFAGSAALQAGVAGAACLLGLTAVLFANFQEAPAPALNKPIPRSRLSFGRLVLMFLALVWLDSAAFYVLQSTPALNRFGWSGAMLQWQNAGIHLGAALLAGWLIDRGRLTRLPLAAMIFLSGAALCVSGHWERVASATHWLYAAGVSLYSVALVCAPASSCDPDLRRAARRAAVLFAVAGWFGSALGIGMAQDLHAIPGWFVALACITVLLARFWLGRPFVPALAACAAAFCTLGLRQESVPGVAASLEPTSTAGREVYVAEGCLNCHSQYVRSGTMDEEWWGPVRMPAEILRQAPPLIGNRRQGPDLLNAGNRRSPVWNRIHLNDPRAVSPSSVMPSYSYLFGEGDRRGESLLLYLAELGADSFGDRLRVRAEWRPAGEVSAQPGSPGHDLFVRNCAQCHGASGAGDGPLLRALGGWLPRNLTLAEWTQMPRGAESHLEQIELARVIKFGIPGTPMAGHETWSDLELMSTAQYVQSLARKRVTE